MEVDIAINFFAGPFHIVHFHRLDARRRASFLSPMQHARNSNRDVSHMMAVSPFPNVRTHQTSLYRTSSGIWKPSFPDSDRAAVSITLLAVTLHGYD